MHGFRVNPLIKKTVQEKTQMILPPFPWHALFWRDNSKKLI